MQSELERGCRFHRAGRVTFHIGKRPTSPVKRQFPEFACSPAIDIVNSSDPGRSLQDLGLIARGACSIRSHGCIMLLCLAQTGLYTAPHCWALNNSALVAGQIQWRFETGPHRRLAVPAERDSEEEAVFEDTPFWFEPPLGEKSVSFYAASTPQPVADCGVCGLGSQSGLI